MNTCKYKIVLDNGVIDSIYATRKEEAIALYSQKTGTHEWYIKEHGLVKVETLKPEK